MNGLLISVIVVSSISTIALIYIWWKTSKIKKQVNNGTYINKNKKNGEKNEEKIDNLDNDISTDEYIDQLRRMS